MCVQVLHLLMSEEYQQRCSRRRTPNRLVSTRVHRHMRENNLFKNKTSRDDNQLQRNVDENISDWYSDVHAPVRDGFPPTSKSRT